MAKLLLENTNIVPLSPESAEKFDELSKKLAGLKIPPYKKDIILTTLRNSLTHREHWKRLLEGLTVSSAIAPLETYIYPILIRAMVRTFADQLVSVQPVQSTLAMVRILKTKYGMGKGKIEEGDYTLQTFGSRGIKFSPYYTSPYVDGEEFSGTVASGGGTLDYTLKFPAVGKITIYLTYGTTPTKVTINLGKGESYTIATNFTVSFSVNNVLTFTNNTGNDIPITAVLTYTTNLEANKSPSIDLALEKLEISVEVRRLFAAATIEALLDLAGHNIKWDTLMSEILAAEIAVELDRSIIHDIISKTIAEGYVDTFSATLPQTWDRPVGEYIKNLYFLIQQANAKIFHRTRRIPGNWIVTSATIAAALEAANYIVVSENYLDQYSGYGFFPLGVLRGLRNKVFVDVSQAFPQNVILVGAKGDSPYDAGYVYAPYTPAIPVLTNIMDIEVPGGVIYMGIYQAAGFRMVDNGFYHIIKIEGDISNLYQTYYQP